MRWRCKIATGATQGMTKSDTHIFVVFRPEGLSVCGEHCPESPGTPESTAALFQEFHQAWKDCVLSSEGGFDGPRAVLVDYDYADNVLSLRTAYRTYTEGLALRETLRERGSALTSGLHKPCAELSWGLSLSTFVLLPRQSILCAQRAQTLAVLPGRWVSRHSEVVEPSDIKAGSMQGLLDRLVEEEMPALKGMGTKKYVGLALKPKLHEWQLIGVLDLRQVPLNQLNAALARLAPDAETAAWGICSVVSSDDRATHLTRDGLSPQLQYTGTFEPDDLAFARHLYEQILP